MVQAFSAEKSENSLKWAVLIALIIDIPFLFILLFSGVGRSFVSLTIMLIPLAITGLIIYVSISAGKSEYIFEEDVLRICFPLSPLNISYDKIRNAEKVDTVLGFRIFGGSLPGAHWGTFMTSNLGKAQVFATKYKGTFVLLETEDYDKILLTPQESDAFLEVLEGKTEFSSSIPLNIVEPRLDQRLAIFQIAIVGLAWIGLVYYVASIYPNLPEIIPVHFGLNGVPNRYGSKMELILMMVVSFIFPFLNTVFALKYGKYNKGLTVFLSVVFLLVIGLFAVIVNQIVQAI